jgi:folate-binding protein YgfZ
MTIALALLADRGVLRVEGVDAARLLQDVISNDLDLLDRMPAVHAGLLSPQGKILFEFFVVRAGDAFLLETQRQAGPELVRRLSLYKLRAKVAIADVSAAYAVCVAWGAAAPQSPPSFPCYRDPRLAELGVRMLAPAGADLVELCAGLGAEPGDWHAHRIALGVPEGGRDFRFGDAFPHEADFDLLNGVSFTKGCFVGQEVVSRMQHRAVVRKRIVPIVARTPLQAGAEITAGQAAIGTVGSVAGCQGLAMLRLDRAGEARARGEVLLAAGTAVTLRRPVWAPAQALPEVLFAGGASPALSEDGR